MRFRIPTFPTLLQAFWTRSPPQPTGGHQGRVTSVLHGGAVIKGRHQDPRTRGIFNSYLSEASRCDR